MKRIWYKKKRYWTLIVCFLLVFFYFYLQEFETPEGLKTVGYNTNLNLENCTLVTESSKWDWDDYSEEYLISVPVSQSLNILNQLKETTGFNTPIALFSQFDKIEISGIWQKTDSVTYTFFNKDNYFPNPKTEEAGLESQMDWPGYYMKVTYNSRNRLLRYKYFKY
jgi:hypothetical protein